MRVMHLLFSSLLLCGLSICLVLAGPSPQWFYEQIHALPVKSDHVTTELHAKKSAIPEHKKRKDGVKRLFNFLDSAIQESGSGSGEGSAQESVTVITKESSGLAVLPEKQITGDGSHKQQEIHKSLDASKNLTSEKQTAEERAKTSFTGHSQPVSTGFPGSGAENVQLANRHAAQSQPGTQRGYVAPQRTAGYAVLSGSQTSTYSPNISPYARPMQAQKTVSTYPVAGPWSNSYGQTTLRTRPPAIPVRSQVTGNEFRSQHSLATSQQLLGGAQRSGIQAPYYITTTITGSNEYGGYNVDAHGMPAADGKSPEPLQIKPYGQLKRQRDQFHQQARALIPGIVPIRTYNRYPYQVPQRNFPGEVRGIIQRRLPYQRANHLVSRAQMPLMQRAVMTAPNAARFPDRVYYRNHIPQQQTSIAFTEHMMRSHGYPLMTRAHVDRAVINRKPQPGNVVTSLTAAAARLVVPARPEAYENSSNAETIGSLSAPYQGAHVVRSSTHPGQL